MDTESGRLGDSGCFDYVSTVSAVFSSAASMGDILVFLLSTCFVQAREKTFLERFATLLTSLHIALGHFR